MSWVGKPSPYEEGVIEYDLEDSIIEQSAIEGSSSSSGPVSMIGEYVLEKPTPKHDQNETPEPRRKKPVIQDIYDEDHYTLARPSVYNAHRNEEREIEETSSSNAQQEKYETKTMTKKKKIICILCIVLISAIGGAGIVIGLVVALESKGKRIVKIQTRIPLTF